MSKHPSLQPKLGRQEVIFLLRKIELLKADATYKGEPADPYREIADLITDLWAAAVVSTSAVSKTLEEAPYEL